MRDILSMLNDQQKEAVVTIGGPVLILAGAGSGKTKALTHRFAYLLKECGVSPLNILCVTFTNKAAKEMQERIERIINEWDGESSGGIVFPWLGTFHKVCVRILRRELDKADLGITSRFIILDDSDQLTVVKRAMSELSIDAKQYNPRAILSQISGAKNEMLGPREYAKYAVGPFQTVVQKVYSKYQSLIRAANALDFDDILLLTVELFKQNASLLEEYQNRFKYIMVDEYQDTNHVQYYLIKLLAKKHGNLFVIGDDWQSVYSWRGADFRNILDFEKDYPDAKIIKLEENYRSTQNILDAAQAVILKNEQRSDKKLWTNGPAGALISVVECLNEKEEGEFVVREIETMVKGGFCSGVSSYDDCVVLYRTNAQSRMIEECFLKYKMPYKIVGSVRFYDRKEIRDMVAYLRLVVNAMDWVSLERVINVPARGIGGKTVELVREWFNNGSASSDASSRFDVLPAKVRNFFELMREIREKCEGASGKSGIGIGVGEIIQLVIDKVRYKDFLLDGSIEGEGRWENVQELISAGEEFDDLEVFLEQISLVQDLDMPKDGVGLAGAAEDRGMVTLMTLHAAKGLEFASVFMVGMEEGIFPHSRSLEDQGEMEEERRLAYVGMTRAKERLYLISAFERRLYGYVQSNPASRFIGEIPRELVERI